MRALIRRLWPMPGDIISRHGRHRGKPALVARPKPEEHIGAEAFKPKEEMDNVGPGRLRPEPDGTFEGWLADEKDDRYLAIEEREFEDDFWAATAGWPDAVAAMGAAVDAVLIPFMAKYGITESDLKDYVTDVAAQKVVDEVDGDIHELNQQLKTEIAITTPTGEYPLVQEAAMANA